jgi:hypothetical protein
MGINLHHDGQSGQQRSDIYQPVPQPFVRDCWLYSVTFLRAHCIYSAVGMPLGQSSRRNRATVPLVEADFLAVTKFPH